MNLHGGSIEGHSGGFGHGSEFIVRLPLMPAADQIAVDTPAAVPASKAAPRRILVVDDNVDAARIMRVLLQLDGHTVEIAHEGNGALETARRFRPEVVLLDLGMPGMDGYAVARSLRRDAGLESVHIVALTGYAREDDQRRTREAGFERHLVKPVERRVLQEMLAGLA